MAPTSFAKPLSPAPPSVRQQHRPSPEVSRQVLPPLRSARLLDQLRERIRLLHYSRRAEEAYVYWCRAFIRFHGLRHPSQMGAAEVEAFQAVLELVRRSGNRRRPLPEHQYGVSRPRCA